MLAETTNLPLEVLMQVAEWISLQATSVAKADILSLILVCRHFHNLFLPILYRYIWVLSFSSRPGPVRKLISALQNQTPSFRHTAVMYIVVYTYPSEDDLYTLLGLCTGLKGLCVHSPRPPPRNPLKYGEAITSTFPSLTRLHLVLDWYSSTSIFGRFAESYPVNITTLTIDVASDGETLFRLDFGVLFPSLRELGLKSYGFGPHWRAGITHVVKTCPDSVTLIFLSLVNAERSLFDDDIRDDTRILWTAIPSLRGAEFSGAKQFLADVTGAPCLWSRARDAASRGERVVTLEKENTNVDGVIPLQTSSSNIGLRTGSTTGSFNSTPNSGASTSSPHSNLTTNGLASGSGGFNLGNGGGTSSSTAQQMFSFGSGGGTPSIAQQSFGFDSNGGSPSLLAQHPFTFGSARGQSPSTVSQPFNFGSNGGTSSSTPRPLFSFGDGIEHENIERENGKAL
ncbi:hypothetical protein DL96DRAFT_1711873 [Flagelloscypha sp. PMI_526]|nr:hypothetical protein DL96DRAFT_1711873 [Flagelloscypha sp. PMI_526]